MKKVEKYCCTATAGMPPTNYSLVLWYSDSVTGLHSYGSCFIFTAQTGRELTPRASCNGRAQAPVSDCTFHLAGTSFLCEELSPKKQWTLVSKGLSSSAWEDIPNRGMVIS